MTPLRFALLLCASAGASLLVGASSAETAFIGHLKNSVTFDDGHRIIQTLASDEFQGRMTGQPGQHLTAELVAAAFAEAGLTPQGDEGTYLQQFPWTTNRIDGAALTIDGTAFTLGTEFICRGDSGAGSVTAEGVYIGYGISDPEQDYDDYAGIDVTGKIVVALRGTHPKVESDWALVGRKVTAALEHGAVGMVLIAAQEDGSFGPLIGSVYFTNGDLPYQPTFPAVQGDGRVARALFAKSPYPIQDLVRTSLEERVPLSTPLGCEIVLSVEGEMASDTITENVAGFLEGSDPKLKHEVIVVGGHMDHVGWQGDVPFCGQDDNASGTATVMEVAQAFATAPARPKRSILFMTFTAEEMGLFGSKHWVAHPTLELERVKAMINIDMSGQGTSFTLHNGLRTTQLDRLCQEANRQLHGLEYTANDTAAASDHVPFWEAGIPAVMVLNGGERDYAVHQIGAWTEEGTDWPIWEQVTETTGLLLWKLANAPRIEPAQS